MSLAIPSRPPADWLVQPVGKAVLSEKVGPHKEITLSNDLIARTWRIWPEPTRVATVSLQNLMTGQELLRAVKPEALIEFDDDGKFTPIGGAVGQPDLAYLTPAWLDSMKAPANGFMLESYARMQVEERFPWKRMRGASGNWPPPGVRIDLNFVSPLRPGVLVIVHTEMYDGIPLMSKWFSVRNSSGKPLRIRRFISENIGFVEAESVVDDNPNWQNPEVTALSDYAFGGMSTNNSNKTAYWVPDKEYKTQVNYNLGTPCDLEMRPPYGPDQIIEPGETFESFRSFLLFHDSTERERKSLALRRMYRTIAPWVTENPIMLHLTSVDPAVVKRAIDQAAECGFEMIVISFWSGLDMEDKSEANLAKFKEFREYANAKGVELGGYSLLASRSIDKANDVVNPKPIFGSSPCLESTWGQAYFATIRNFFDQTGFNLLEHDGSYPGDTCASSVHPGHRGLEDSQWNQYRRISDFYKFCRSKGIFLNVPDNYFLVGSNKTGMGYRESNWSLPRAQQHIHARQNLFDGTWDKTPSMGWMMTPLVEYQGGGAEATIEPLKEHLDDYRLHLLNNFGYGAQSCYRGPRIYDAPETKAMVVKWVGWFKKYRDILESDVIHVRRADGRKLDAILHVNPNLPIKAMAVVYNPTDKPMRERFRLPLYYSGLRGSCRVKVGSSTTPESKESKVNLRETDLEIDVEVPGKGCTWVICR